MRQNIWRNVGAKVEKRIWKQVGKKCDGKAR